MNCKVWIDQESRKKKNPRFQERLKINFRTYINTLSKSRKIEEDIITMKICQFIIIHMQIQYIFSDLLHNITSFYKRSKEF